MIVLSRDKEIDENLEHLIRKLRYKFGKDVIIVYSDDKKRFANIFYENRNSPMLANIVDFFSSIYKGSCN
jgi:hypothetical protein